MTSNRVRELYQQYVDGMEPWQIRLAIARLMHFRVPQEAWPDTMQELAIVIHGFTFDAEKAHAAGEQTILCRRLDNRIRTLARAHARRTAALDRLGALARSEEETRGPEASSVEGDVRAVVATLTPLQQQICRGLMEGLSALQIAKQTGRHYTTIQRQILQIRKTFSGRGIRGVGGVRGREEDDSWSV